MGFGPRFGAGVTLPDCTWVWCGLCPGLSYRLAVSPGGGCSRLGGIARPQEPVWSRGQICRTEPRAPATKACEHEAMVPVGRVARADTSRLGPHRRERCDIFSSLIFPFDVFPEHSVSGGKKKKFLFSCFSLIWDENETLKYSYGPRRCLAISINTAACILIAGLLARGEHVQLRLGPALGGGGLRLPSLPGRAGVRDAVLLALGVPGCGVAPSGVSHGAAPNGAGGSASPGRGAASPPGSPSPTRGDHAASGCCGNPGLWVLLGALGAFGWFAASRWH